MEWCLVKDRDNFNFFLLYMSLINLGLEFDGALLMGGSAHRRLLPVENNTEK
jgi:hypothetical protein